MSETLETFTVSAKGTRGAGVVHVIKQALAAPGVFVFGELLDVPSVQELATNPDHKKWHDLLAIFAYGTYDEYKAKKGDLPELGDTELNKLKALTVLSLASEHRVLRYDFLRQSLDISDVRKLEDLLIEAITSGLINGKLDQRHMQMEVFDTTSRDLKPTDMDNMLHVLSKWLSDSQQVLNTIKEVEESSIKSYKEKQANQKALEDKITTVKTQVRKSLVDGGEKGMEGYGDFASEIELGRLMGGGVGDPYGGRKKRMPGDHYSSMGRPSSGGI
eukprot:NODE_4402_length_1069_cov_100.399577_g4203_i0.p1 GENE.NODE_4402_length_1069_cov_100.399577_g4203_i0~~NODE_4402_length_1069_cov_100.399577_g4203_i0.p1  ORF type:complete len:292 (-),score=73.30 NODE_4402_length_1069_cov_100.399577_g4203_i0:193-1014(-)